MDNDCETEADVLETAKKTVLEDLEYALQLQRGEVDGKGDSDDSSTSESDLSSYHSDEDENDSLTGSEESSTVQSDICSQSAKKNVKFLKNFSQ
jgi:hypothetical protein